MTPSVAFVTVSYGPDRDRCALLSRSLEALAPSVEHWIVVDRADPWVVSRGSPILTNHPEVVDAFVARLEEDSAWRKVFDRAGVVVYDRQSAR